MPLHLSPHRAIGAAIGVLAAFPASASAGWQSFQPQRRTASSCPDYSSYSAQPHGPYSSGPLKLPYMRPSEECRTFKSPAVEVSVDALCCVATAGIALNSTPILLDRLTDTVILCFFFA